MRKYETLRNAEFERESLEWFDTGEDGMRAAIPVGTIVSETEQTQNGRTRYYVCVARTNCDFEPKTHVFVSAPLHDRIPLGRDYRFFTSSIVEVKDEKAAEVLSVAVKATVR